MTLTFNQTIELLGLSTYEALTLCALGLFLDGERLGNTCHLVFPINAIKGFIAELRERGELYCGIELAIGRPLDV